MWNPGDFERLAADKQASSYLSDTHGVCNVSISVVLTGEQVSSLNEDD